MVNKAYGDDLDHLMTLKKGDMMRYLMESRYDSDEQVVAAVEEKGGMTRGLSTVRGWKRAGLNSTGLTLDFAKRLGVVFDIDYEWILYAHEYPVILPGVDMTLPPVLSPLLPIVEDAEKTHRTNLVRVLVGFVVTIYHTLTTVS